MNTQTFQKGKFYTLPIKDIRTEGNNAFFIVEANDKDYAIHMFDFQRKDPSLRQLDQLPCMVKDIHGDNIVFVQNFAQMFRERYLSGNTYPFIVNREANNSAPDYRYYDIRDSQGVPFKLKCKKDTYLTPHQRIRCVVSRPTQNRMVLTLENTQNVTMQKNCISPQQLLATQAIEERWQRFLLKTFDIMPGFEEARQYYRQGNPEWVVKAITAVTGVEQWPRFSNDFKEQLLKCYLQICLYLLEDSDYLLQFAESDRDNFQTWIAERVATAETYLECFSIISQDRCGEEIDRIIQKISSSGYICHPHHRMRLLIAIFSLKPELLEEKIDTILDLIGRKAKDWKGDSFTDAFASFLLFYVTSNKDRTNREAIVDNTQSNMLLGRMTRSICYLLLMTDSGKINVPMYRSLLFHYLSFVRRHNVLGKADQSHDLAEQLVDKAFTSLLVSEDDSQDFGWNKDFSQTELLAHQMAMIPARSSTFLTRSFEAHQARFTVSADGITIARQLSGPKEKNILPAGLLDWQNTQIFLDQASKYAVSRHSKMRTWKTFWNDVELSLFEERKVAAKPKKRKQAPDVGTEVTVRVLWKDDDYSNRYYCRIEDNFYEGEGWIDTYLKGGSTGMFHYDPMLDVYSFYKDGKPILFRVRVQALGSPKEEKHTYTFDAMGMLDNFIKDAIVYGDEGNCTVIFHDKKANTFLGIMEDGYGVFMQRSEDFPDPQIGDTVTVRVTDTTRANAIQGEIVGPGTKEVNIKEAAENVLHLYAEEEPYEETEEEMEEEVMAASEDLFEPEYIKQIINILDHKAVLESDNAQAYAFLSVAHILARMTDDNDAMLYLEQRRHFLSILEDYGENEKINDEELERLSKDNDDIIGKFPLLKERLSEMKIVNCFGQQDKNDFLWAMVGQYEPSHILNKLSRLMLSCNMVEGFGLQEQQKAIITKIKTLLNVNVELPQIYSFGEEDQQTEFKTSMVYPPNNNMRPDLRQQTFNILKVICGMANAYGGTLYLGVNDTGTARGLAEDLEYFEGSKDKFDLYIRNQIRMELGDTVNASIVVEHPEAGKHWIYAIKVAASMSAVALKLDNKYYFREGSSTYPFEMLDIVDLMNKRDFSRYDTKVADAEGLAPLEEDDAPKDNRKETPARKPASAASDIKISTSAWRSNITENWIEGYGIETSHYLRIQSLGNWCMLNEAGWQDGLLTLAIHDDELNGSLIIVYEDGCVNRVPMAQLTDKAGGGSYKMCTKKPFFVCPAREDDALLTAYRDDKGKEYFRLDDITAIEEDKMQADGKRLTDVDFSNIVLCDIISKEHLPDLQRLRNPKRSNLGMQLMTAYAKKEQEALKKMGILL